MTDNRSLKPYPPASVEITDTANVGGGTQIDWLNRNRLHPAIVKQTDPTQTLEVGQTTTIEFYNDALALIHTESGLTGATFTYDDADEIADAGALSLLLTIVIKSVRDGHESATQTLTTFRGTFVTVGGIGVEVGTDEVYI